MKCPRCKSENPEDAKFCIDCGAPMELRCPNCGAATPAKGSFCKECGHDLSKPEIFNDVLLAGKVRYQEKNAGPDVDKDSLSRLIQYST